MSARPSDTDPSGGKFQRAKTVASLWRVWILGIAMTALFGFSVVSPAMGEGYFYEFMFGGIAIVAFVYGGRELAESEHWA